MKKIFFVLVAAIYSMSLNAQIVKFMKGNTVVATYDASEVDNVVFEDETLATTGTAKARRYGQDIDVKWVQLWSGGPKFAEYNVGTYELKPESESGLYCWGKTKDFDTKSEYYTGSSNLTGTDDTATAIWGSNWRMPTESEYEKLVQNCTSEWITINGVNGRLFTGKGDYAGNSVFFPAHGYKDTDNYYSNEAHDSGWYWASTRWNETLAICMVFTEAKAQTGARLKSYGMSVRAVLK